MCGWTLLFPWIGKAGAIALGAVAVLFNALVLPRLPIGKSVSREGDRRWTGIQWYPVAVLGLVVLLPLPLAAGGWGVLAAGDAASNVVGRRWGRAKLPWNPRKSWAGTIAFALAAAPASCALMGWWYAHTRPDATFEDAAPVMILGSAAAAILGALVETIPSKIDDNLTVAAGAGAAHAIVAGCLGMLR